jgi:hypothetical protein
MQPAIPRRLEVITLAGRRLRRYGTGELSSSHAMELKSRNNITGADARRNRIPITGRRSTADKPVPMDMTNRVAHPGALPVKAREVARRENDAALFSP